MPNLEPMGRHTTVRAVIFDFNGVLVDDEHVHYELFRELLAQEGIALSEAAYHERFLGLDDRGCFATALGEAGQSADRARVDELIARKARRYAQFAATGLRFFPGVAACLDDLARSWPLAICSGALRPEIEYALRRLERLDSIRAIVSAEDTKRCKPDPEGYLLALEALRGNATNDLAASQCVVVEDSLAGVESAKRAGMRAIGVTHTYTDGELKHAGADAVVSALSFITSAWITVNFTSAEGATEARPASL